MLSSVLDVDSVGDVSVVGDASVGPRSDDRGNGMLLKRSGVRRVGPDPVSRSLRDLLRATPGQATCGSCGSPSFFSGSSPQRSRVVSFFPRPCGMAGRM